MKNKTFRLQLAERELKIEFNDFAEQASGSCFVQYGDTLVLSTAAMSRMEKLNQDFFPLTVEYEERFYAAGKIRGSRFFKRESKPTDEAICNARLIDRTIRPLFPQELTREIQVVTTVLSWDNQNEPDVLGILAASLALSTSNIPWQGPASAARVGIDGDNFILNPTYEQRGKGKIDVVFTATEKNNELLINMIEGGFEEIDEETIIRAFQFAKPFLQKLIDFQKDIIKEMGEEKISLPDYRLDPELEIKLRNFLGERLEGAVFQKEKGNRIEDLETLKAELIEFVKQENPEKILFIPKFFEEEINLLVHKMALEKERRADGRKLDEIRGLSCLAGLLPRTHGSGLFRRGQTHALSILTLGSPGDQQLLEGMEIVGKKRFMHHYNFPPYSTGETKPMRGPGRREIGHGMLAEKALLPLIPNHEEFPYTIRVVTEILSSNGSSSMAAVSASSLALMDAGVPIKTAATGISLGLMSDEKGNYKILTDIQGPEDHHGDMDFKVAGTKNGVTAIQMDVKISGITENIFKETLDRGKKARAQILEEIGKTLKGPRPELSPFAPRILTLQINPEKIREVIGPGGKIINEIIDACKVQIDIEDTGKIFIMGEKEEAAKKALEWIQNITRTVEVGEIFQGKIKRIMAFGAFAEILPGQEGLIHISQLADYRVEKVEDIVKIGDIMPVKVISIDDQGRINLSLKDARESKR